MREPLAFRMRPITLNEVIGQEHLIGENQVIRKCVENKVMFSMIFYGPPGTGKTTLAMVLANELELPYRLFNAVTGNKKDLEIIFEEAKYFPGLVVIIDEVHRLNKDKQDLLLPHVESGAITLIGATTSNPLFAINPAIRSRAHLFEIKPNSADDIKKALTNAVTSEKGLNNQVSIEEEALKVIANHVNGDIRYALNILEICFLAANNGVISAELVRQYSQFPNMSVDKNGDGHYDILSAFQKSIRGSDVDAAIYYLGCLVAAGDMDSIERRLLVIAYEDIGLGNPAVVSRVINAIDAAKRVGFPEGRIPLSVAIIDLCLSPKSKSAEGAIDEAMNLIKNETHQIPDYLKFTPVQLDEASKYPYDRADLWNSIQYLPDRIAHLHFYHPNSNSPYEQTLANNYAKLTSHKRSNKLADLKKKK